jgi:putative MATE family efflux protein
MSIPPAGPAPAAAPTPQEAIAIRRDVLALAWPVVVQNLFRTLMFYVDTFMIGGVGEEAMAAMGVVGPISWTLISVFGALSVGTIATVARAWGEGDRAKQEGEAATAAGVALLLGIPLSLLGMALLPGMAALFRVPGAPAVELMARRYLFIEAAAFLFFMMDFVGSAILRAAGRTAFPMIVSIVANGLNLFLNWVFIYGHLGAPRMEVAGAALATSIAFAFQGAVTLGYLFTPHSPIRLGWGSFRQVSRQSVARLVRVSIPAAIEPLILQSGFLVYNKAITLLGATPMAAHRAAITVESLTFMPGYGFAVAGSAIVGQFLGAGQPARAEQGFRESARMATYLMSGLGLVFLFFSVPLSRLFLRGGEADPAVYASAICLAISALEQPFMALAMSLGGALRGAGDTRSPVIVALAGVWGVRVPLAWTLAFRAGLGLYGIWITMIVDWAVRTLVFSLLYRRGTWKTLKL